MAHFALIRQAVRIPHILSKGGKLELLEVIPHLGQAVSVRQEILVLKDPETQKQYRILSSSGGSVVEMIAHPGQLLADGDTVMYLDRPHA